MQLSWSSYLKFKRKVRTSKNECQLTTGGRESTASATESIPPH